jgi:hypothetical protein
MGAAIIAFGKKRCHWMVGGYIIFLVKVVITFELLLM